MLSRLSRGPAVHCECLPMKTLRSRRALFEESGSVRAPRGSGPAACRGTAKACVVGIADGSISGD